MTKRILLGHIASAHGIRGEVVIKSYTAVPEDIARYGALSDEAGRRTFTIESARMTGKGVIARLAGVADRTAAEALRGTALMVERSALPPADDGDYYLADLVGISATAPDGSPLGTIVSVQNFGAGDLLELRLHTTKQTEFVPFTDTYVPTVDIHARTATVVMPVMVGDPEPGHDGADADNDNR